MSNQKRLPGVGAVLAVASGKGGVGKTTVTVNLALALQRLGARAGIFDADVFGPNVPLMLGIHRRRAGHGYVPIARRRGAEAEVPPLERFGLQVMSMGLLVAEDQLINPLAEVAGLIVVETLRSVQWRELDYLLVDLPPSAGQPQQELLERVKLDGVLIVTTPQDLSLLDASRSLKLYAEAGVPVLGLVENMAYFVCPTCGERHEVFEPSERWRPEALQGVPVLGRLPLAPGISHGINRRHPLMAPVADANGPAAEAEDPATGGNGANNRDKAVPAGDRAQVQAFMEIAAAVRARLAEAASAADPTTEEED